MTTYDLYIALLNADYDRYELLGMSYTELLTIFETEFLES